MHLCAHIDSELDRKRKEDLTLKYRVKNGEPVPEEEMLEGVSEKAHLAVSAEKRGRGCRTAIRRSPSPASFSDMCPHRLLYFFLP